MQKQTTSNPYIDKVLDTIAESEGLLLSSDILEAAQQVKTYIAEIYGVDVSEFDKKGKLNAKNGEIRNLVAFLIYRYLTQDLDTVSKHSHLAVATLSDYAIKMFDTHWQTYRRAILEALDTKIKKASD